MSQIIKNPIKKIFSAHWFLAIICFPGFVGKVQVPATKESEVKKTVNKTKKPKEIKLQAVTIGNTTITPVTATITLDPGDEGSERDEAEGDDEEMEMDSDEEVSDDYSSHQISTFLRRLFSPSYAINYFFRKRLRVENRLPKRHKNQHLVCQRRFRKKM